jgi:hypothetical protein
LAVIAELLKNYVIVGEVSVLFMAVFSRRFCQDLANQRRVIGIAGIAMVVVMLVLLWPRLALHIIRGAFHGDP